MKDVKPDDVPYFLARAYREAMAPKVIVSSFAAKFDHLRHMLECVFEDRKGHRWIGFIQGQFEMTGVFTIDELRAHVRLAKAVASGTESEEGLKTLVEKQWKNPTM